MTLLYVFPSLLLSAASALKAPQLVSARRGQDVLLECRGPPEADVSLFTWTKAGLDSDYVFFYRNDRSYSSHQHRSFRGRVELRDMSSMRDGDFSVVLQNVSEADEGSYRCDVVTRSSGGAAELHITRVNLTVSEKSPGTDEDQEEEKEEEVMDGDVGFLFLAMGIAVLMIVLLIVIISCFLWMKRASLSKYRLANLSEKKTRPGSDPIGPAQTV